MSELPIQPDEATLEELLDLARWLVEHPENRRGADKTWVLAGLRSCQQFFREAKASRKFSDDAPAPVQAMPPDPEQPHST